MIVAALGQTILTATGMRSGWISSTVSVSPPLMGPEDRMVDLATGTRFLDKWVLRPVSERQSPGGPLLLPGLVPLGQPITSDRLHDQLHGRLGKSWVDSQRRARVRLGRSEESPAMTVGAGLGALSRSE